MTREEQLTAELKKHDYDDICSYLMFLRGIRWADEHPVDVWHDASEMPKEGEWILIQFDEDSYDTLVLCGMDADTFCAWCKKCDVIRWAYICDLLPKGGEE